MKERRMALADLRIDYTQRGLTEEDAGHDPMALFQRWMDEAIAAGIPEPNAMTLATVSSDGQPSARIVLLKLLDERGLAFFTNYGSRKGREIAENPRASVVFFWAAIERQVRVEGVIEKTTEAESEDYFHSRPANSRLGAWASEQSEPLSGREELEAKHAALVAKYPDGKIPRPPHWGGYRLIPSAFEYWQGRPSRLHDRIRFVRVDGRWERVRLSP